MRSRSTIEFLGLWEKINNPGFKPAEFDRFRDKAGSNVFRLPPQRWINATNAIGIISKSERALSKINYNIHTDAIKNNLIPDIVTKEQIDIIYADEADIINVALFGITAKQWRKKNPEKEGNMRDYANVAELVCLVNLENLNSVYINEVHKSKR